jgi:UDP-N-acetylglucosamine acyltransferase
MTIHPTAIVDAGALLGADVQIGPFCLVGAGVRLGDGVRLMSHVSITGNTVLGARSVVYPQAVLGGDGQFRGNDFADARLEIGEDCVLREGVTMNGGSRRGGGLTRIGARGYFMAYSHVGHDCDVGEGVTFANSVALGGHCHIGEGVNIGGLSAVQQFCRVGRGAMIGGITGVNRDVIPFAMAFGDHAELAGLNLIGLKRRGLSRTVIHALRGAFRSIFYGVHGSLSDRARDAKAKWPAVTEVAELADFILADAKQPLCLARRRGRDAD